MTPPTKPFTDEQRLARYILQVAQGRGRFLVGIAGVPGSGKSTLARHLKDAIDHIAQRPGLSAVVPLDGFHLTNSELKKRGLSDRKGSPETFRVSMFYARAIELKRGNSAVSLPTYSREVHEPIPDAIEVRPEHAIVLVEGNYILCDFGVWRSVASLFDLRVYVETAREQARQWILDRHVRGGLTPEEAAAKYEMSDLPNTELIEPAKSHADVVFRMG